jgi:hypothetical protein
MIIDTENIEIINHTHFFLCVFSSPETEPKTGYPRGICFSTALTGSRAIVPEEEYAPVADLVVVDPV